MTTSDQTRSGASRGPRGARRTLVLAFAATLAGAILIAALPADAARAPRPTTTTTRKATTTTTKAPTTTTKAPATTTSTTTTLPPTTTTTVPPTTTTTTTMPPQGPACGGQTPAKASGGTWACTFTDEFDGSSLDRTKWVPIQTQYTGWTSGAECYMDDPDNVSVSNGALRITARIEAAPVTCGAVTSNVTTGSVSTHGKFSQAFGRFEIRARFPAVSAPVPGLHSAMWLWPDEPTYGPWPASGEIDIAEVYSVLPDRAIPALHYVSDVFNPNTWNPYCFLDPSEFHTYVAEWTPASIRISFDGQLCLEDTITNGGGLTAPQPFDKPFFMVLTQALGAAGGTNPFDPNVTPLPATMQVDYVRVWE